MNCIRNRIIISVLVIIFFCPSILTAQTPGQSSDSSPVQALDLDDRSFITKALTQITTRLAEDEGRERAEISANIKAEKDTEAELNEIRKKKNEAAVAVISKRMREKDAQTEYETIRSGASAGGGDLRAASRQYEKAVRERGAAERTFEILAESEQNASQKLVQLKESRENAEQSNRIKAIRRAQQKEELERLYIQWQNNPTEANLIILTDQITAIACEQDITANPYWKTTPTLGANIYYQSIGERNRGAAPNPINNPTQTQQPICLGKYYIWAERGGRATSDKNKRFTVYLGITEIVVVEDR